MLNGGCEYFSVEGEISTSFCVNVGLYNFEIDDV